MSNASAVDLSRLPSPDAVETLAFENIYNAMRAELALLDPAMAAELRDSDPAALVLQVAAYREMHLRQRINDAVRAVMLAHATGTDLDNIVAREPYNIARLVIDEGDPTASPPLPPVLESDDALRRRAQLAPARYSTAGPVQGYVFHALTAHPDILDASVASPAPGEVVVTVMSRHGTGAPSAEALEAVEAAVNADTARPLTDQVTVQAAAVIEYEIEAELILYPGPDEAVVMASATQRLEAYTERMRRLGLDVTLSGIYGALHTEGVQRVSLIEPAADLVIAPHQVSLATALDITYGGRDE